MTIILYMCETSRVFVQQFRIMTTNMESQNEKHLTKNDQEKHRKTCKFNEGNCAVCLISPQVDEAFPPCGHTFCFVCLIQWSKMKNECPMCRQTIFPGHLNNDMIMSESEYCSLVSQIEKNLGDTCDMIINAK